VKKLLIIDDDPTLLSGLARFFSSQGFSVVASSDIPDTAALRNGGAVDLAILDIALGPTRREGLDLLKAIKDAVPTLPVVMFSGNFMGGLDDEATDLGAAAIVNKPEIAELARVVRALLIP
jgi:two-component system, response regulator RegA